MAAIALVSALHLSAQIQTLEIVKLADRVYAAIYSEFRADPIEGNSLIVIGADGVLVLDSGHAPDSARAVIAEIRKLTDRPVRYVVNSHWHDDHIFGNSAYAEAFPGVEFIAHRQTRADMIERSIPSLKDYGVEYWTKMAERFEQQLARGTRPDGTPLSEAVKSRLRDQARSARNFLPKIDSLSVVLPTVVVDAGLTIYLGTREIRIINAPGNTPGDLAVYLPQEQILATGDLLVHPTPFAYGSDLVPWIRSLTMLAQLETDAIVPGHGPVIRDKVYLGLVTSLLESVVEQVTAAKKAGLTLEETRKKIDVASFRTRMSGDDGFRRAQFDDSILREAVERTYKAIP
jgi:glyoxylase-like metal-dependent hydrolase (beta-lactamase superfamily II)